MTASPARHARRLLTGLCSALLLIVAAGVAGLGTEAANAWVPSMQDGLLSVTFDYAEVQAVYHDASQADAYCRPIADYASTHGVDLRPDVCAGFLKDCVARAPDYTLRIEFGFTQYTCYRIG